MGQIIVFLLGQCINKMMLIIIVEARKSAIRTYFGTRARVFGKQTHATDREIRNGDNF